MRKQSPPRDAGFNTAILVGALATGAVTDFAIRALGVKLPPLFTVLWGSGAALLLIAASTNKRRKRAQEARLNRRIP
jgi:predicted MFS family arabinose efflux permease